MSNKKIVRISENELVELIDNIVAEAVVEKKKQWIAENKTKSGNLLEQRIKGLEEKLEKITKSK